MAQRILVVDDNPDSVAIMRNILESRGYTVFVAAGGAAALQIVSKEPLDLVLLDVMMPEMSGIEVLQQIKDNSQTSRLPVILVTAKTHDEDVMVGYQYGADYYITKPFTAKQLLYGISLVLGKGESVG
ncbi:MAG TPA: response regulator [Candidatus Margulisiibacteriota bacterium]|nr:response regulator [Candidatus Margulisiibacteriota bacterium]